MKRLKIFAAALFAALLFSSCVNFLPPRSPATQAPPKIEMPQNTPPPQGKGNEIDMARITEQNVSDLVLSLTRPESYVWRYNVKYCFADFERVTKNTVYVDAGRLCYEREENDAVVLRVYVLGGKVYVVDPGAKKYNSFSYDGDADPLIAVSAVGDVLSLSDVRIDAGDEITVDSEVCVLLRVEYEPLKLYETYIISLRTGLPLSVVSDIDGYIYELETLSADMLSPIDDGVFSLPDFVR